jgi:hypothetical protein
MMLSTKHETRHKKGVARKKRKRKLHDHKSIYDSIT